MTDLGEHHHGLGDIGLDRAAVAEIRRDRLPEALLVVGDDSAQPRQPVEPLGKAGRRLGPRPRDHGTEGFLNGPKRGARRGAVQGAIQGVVHGILLPLKWRFRLVLWPQAGPLWNFWQGRAKQAANSSTALS